MTKRQWLIVQVAMVMLRNAVCEGTLDWSPEGVGPPPTCEELDEIVKELSP